jgi:hypothetical protein
MGTTLSNSVIPFESGNPAVPPADQRDPRLRGGDGYGSRLNSPDHHTLRLKGLTIGIALSNSVIPFESGNPAIHQQISGTPACAGVTVMGQG